MHLIFERSNGRFRSNCNILALAWMPYYDEAKFRHSLFDYHRKQLINLTSSINNPGASWFVDPSSRRNLPSGANESLSSSGNREAGGEHQAYRTNNNEDNRGNNEGRQSGNLEGSNQRDSRPLKFLNSRLAELHNRHQLLTNTDLGSTADGRLANNGNKCNIRDKSAANISKELNDKFGRSLDFGWLVVGNIAKIVGITLTSVIDPIQSQELVRIPRNLIENDDLIKFYDDSTSMTGSSACNKQPTADVGEDSQPEKRLTSETTLSQIDTKRPDQDSARVNYNLRGHLDEVILVKWNELYQKLATVDSKGNVFIWCKINEKFTIQTPFYNRTKSVADFKWSNDGKTALICYTDSFILVGSSSGQRHWHSMLNLDEYHITCASWTPNDEQILLGVSNGNVVVIDLPRSELTELVVNQTNIRAMCWSSCDINLDSNCNPEISPRMCSSPTKSNRHPSRSNYSRKSSSSSKHSNSTVVNHRRLSRDYSVFSKYRLCSQALSNQPDGNNQTVPVWNQALNPNDNRNILAIDFANNTIKLYESSLNDPDPKTIQVNQESYIMHWSSDGKILAVAGFTIHTSAPSVGCLRCRYHNSIKFYNQNGKIVHEHVLEFTRYPITAFTWAHENNRIFVATGPKLHCAKVFFGVPSLNLLSMSAIQRNTKLPNKRDVIESVLLNNRLSFNTLDWRSRNCPIDICRLMSIAQKNNRDNTTFQNDDEDEPIKVDLCNNSNVFQMKLPFKLKLKIDQLFTKTIQQPYDENWTLNDIIWHVPRNDKRFYCTLVCYTSNRAISSLGSNQYNNQYNQDSRDRDNECGHQCNVNHACDHNKIFILYVEFQGSMIPILRARRVGFLKPEFVIFDPEDGQINPTQREYRKVSDVSQQSASNNNSSMVHQSRLEMIEAQQLQSQQAGTIGSFKPSDSFYFERGVGGLSENCSGLHSFNNFGEPRASTSSSIGRQSAWSDAEHYYNFDDPIKVSGNKPIIDNDKLADLMIDRSHHQEPIALPITSNPYLMYMSKKPPSSLGVSQTQQYLNNSIGKTPHGQFNNRPSKRPPRNSITSAKNLTELKELVRIKSNIWGTKFKIVNVGNRTIRRKSILGSVVYKASILHLQPRQIFLNVKDMSNYCCLCSKHHHTRNLNITKTEAIRAHSQSSSIPPFNASKNQVVSLIDLPNHHYIDTLATPMRMTDRESRSHRRERRGRSTKQLIPDDDNKVVVRVGDAIKIAPKLEQNQQYKYVVSGASSSCSDSRGMNTQKPSNSKDSSNDRRRYPKDLSCVQLLASPSTRDSGKLESSMLNHTRGILLLSDAKRSAKYRQMTGTSSAQDATSNQTESFRDLADDQDDVLTLSLGQGDQVRVEMSSLRSFSPHTDSNQEDLEIGKQRPGRLEEFLDTNKTLKSIQTITKMIVDLSSKADEIASNEQERIMFSPSKQAKLSENQSSVSPIDWPTASTSSGSSKFVPPDTPVHKPRRIPGGRSLEAAKLAEKSKYQSLSANVTPLKYTSSANRVSGRCGNLGESKQHRRARRTDDRDNHSLVNSSKLPPPPPSVPIGRKLSSSAKRLLDGSLRSLYGVSSGGEGNMVIGGHSTSMSDVEPEETEPLVSSRSTRRANGVQGKDFGRLLGLSQPNSPMKSLSSFGRKHSSDLANFKSNLVDRLRSRLSDNNLTPKTSRRPSSSDRSDSGFVKANDTPKRWLWNNNYQQKTSSLEGHFSVIDRTRVNDNTNDMYCSGATSSSEDLRSSTDSSASSGVSEDDDGGDEHDQARARRVGDSKRLFASQFRDKISRLGYGSNSVKDLRQLKLSGRMTGSRISDEGNGSADKSRVKRRRKLRAKSICANPSCCCARENKLQNRPPVWNEVSQVYQLDFGGRVTQESAKNLQIDHEGQLALQFGRIDRCSYTLDYKYPFNAIQAMAIAMASLTQRLK